MKACGSPEVAADKAVLVLPASMWMTAALDLVSMEDQLELRHREAVANSADHLLGRVPLAIRQQVQHLLGMGNSVHIVVVGE